MAADGINSSELARRLGVSRARITKWLALLELPEEVIRGTLKKGDNWDHRPVTERELRIWQKGNSSDRGK